MEKQLGRFEQQVWSEISSLAAYNANSANLDNTTQNLTETMLTDYTILTLVSNVVL